MKPSVEGYEDKDNWEHLATMTIDDVLAKIKKAKTLPVYMVMNAHCAVCYKHATRAISIYKPQSEVIPLCQAHLGEARVLQEATKGNQR